MALTLNTSHPLYGNLIEAVGIDSGALKALVNPSKTFTAASGTTYVNGTYGTAFKTVKNGYTPAGASMSPAINTDTTVTPNLTIVAVFNNLVVGDGNGAFLAGSLSGGAVANLTINSAGKFEVTDNNNGIVATSNGTITGTHSVAVTRTGETGGALYIDGALDKNFTSMLSWNSTNRNYDIIGGTPGFGSTSVELVWLFVFNKVLTATEISNLHASLGASNTMTSNGQTALVANSGAATPTVTSVTLLPATGIIAGGGTQQFTWTVNGTNSPSQAVTFTYSPQPAGSSLTAGGLFTGPAATGVLQEFAITATSVLDPTKSDVSYLQIMAAGSPTVNSVTVTPETAIVNGGATQQLNVSVNVSNGAAQTVTWASSPAGATVSSSGLFTAPAATAGVQTFTVTATSTVDGTKSDSCVITVPAITSAGTFSIPHMRNNGEIVGNRSIRYSWFPGGRLGALAGITPIEGVVTSDANGVATVTGLPAGAGVMLGAQYINGPTDDLVFYKAGVVT